MSQVVIEFKNWSCHCAPTRNVPSAPQAVQGGEGLYFLAGRAAEQRYRGQRWRCRYIILARVPTVHAVHTATVATVCVLPVLFLVFPEIC